LETDSVHPVASGRTVFFVSDGTGITAETFGSSILAQFDQLRFQIRRLPFVEDLDKANEARITIDEQGELDGRLPIVFLTLVNPEISARIKTTRALHLDLFQTFVEPLERELQVKSSHTIGRFHHTTEIGRASCRERV
jgi:regulator of PEP synthase PpsR (kinase-PPPase family)